MFLCHPIYTQILTENIMHYSAATGFEVAVMKSLFKTLTKCAAGIEDSVIVHSIYFMYHLFYTSA
jgi:hypothetical protein